MSRVAVAFVMVIATSNVCTAQRTDGKLLPVVDQGVQPVERLTERSWGNFETPSFRNQRDGWIFSHYGPEIFRTTDGGLSWRRAGELEAALEAYSDGSIDWISETVGVAQRTSGQMIARTVDGGASWSAVQLPGRLDSLWDGTRAGPLLWRIGHNFGSGLMTALMRSDDAGATWSVIEAPLPGTQCCRAISFADRDHGWAWTLSPRAQLFATSDGGLRWSAVAQSPELGLKSLHLFSDRIGRAVGWDERHVGIDAMTADGGRTWFSQSIAPRSHTDAPTYLAKITVGESTHTLFTTRPARDLRELMRAPLVDLDSANGMAPYGTNGVVATSGRGPFDALWLRTFYYFVDGKLVRAEPPLTAPSGKRERLLGVGSVNALLKWGWTHQHIYQSSDGGNTWFRAADAPEPLRRVKYFEPGCGVAETISGLLLRPSSQTTNWFRTRVATFEAFSSENCRTGPHAILLHP